MSAALRHAKDPDIVGRFRIRRRLGAGAMGVVLVGRDETLDRDVAVKLVRPGRRSAASAEKARARLLREAQAMAKVAHPNVVAVYEAGTHGDDVYIAMELVDGVGLDAWLRAEPRAVRDVLERFVDAGRGLAAAHAMGIVHRDFKPANVLVGNDGRTRVGDFGLARAAGDAETSGDVEAPGAESGSSPNLLSAELTGQGALVGTPAYMSLEHFKGKATAESDQWSFAVALYRAIYGVPPYEGDGIVALYEAIMKGPAPAPPPKPDVPPRVAAAILRALSIEAADRWPSMEALVAEIEAELRVDPDRDPARSRRQRRAIAIAISLFGVVSGGVAAYRTSLGRTMGFEYVLVQSALAFGAMSAATIVFRRTVLRDAHGRRLVALFFIVIGAQLLHRALAFVAGDTSLATVLRGDAVFVAAITLFAGIVLERWIAFGAVMMAAFVVVSFVLPSFVVAAFGAAIIGFLALGVWFWREPQPPLLRRSGLDRSSSRSR
ncbi:MAG: serine/threonine protein kinase [Labilithrix sp.]|nr:serine/threonine protein kinase [Labilithrix sp.]MCW5813598.1 serine/threonine protein kinase [Labilithrix sp.]